MSSTLDKALAQAKRLLQDEGKAVLITPGEGDSYTLSFYTPAGVDELVTYHPKTAQRASSGTPGKGGYAFAKNLEARDLDTLRSYGLPEYWNKERYLELYDEHGSDEAIAVALGLGENKGVIISQYVSRAFGIRKGFRHLQRRRQILSDYYGELDESKRPNAYQLAEKYDTTPVNIYRWLEQAERGVLRPHQRRKKANADA